MVDSIVAVAFADYLPIGLLPIPLMLLVCANTGSTLDCSPVAIDFII